MTGILFSLIRLWLLLLSIADYNEVVELNSSFASAYSNRGLAHHGLGQYQMAIADYNKAIELNPFLAVAYNNRGSSYGILEQYQKAIINFEKAAQLFTAQNNLDAARQAQEMIFKAQNAVKMTK